MKNFFIIILSALACLIDGQIYKIQYDFIVHNVSLNKDFYFPAELFVNSRNNNKLYTVQFGIVGEESKDDDFFVSKKKPKYILYSEVDKVLILDYIPNSVEQNYFFMDNYSMVWKKINETKKLNAILLKKAETFFRGRRYICWYNDQEKITEGVWKFKNLPGLAYEIKDDSGQFSWKLKKQEIASKDVINPFLEYKALPLPYNKYPELRYGVSEDLKKKLENNPHLKQLSQERDGLEIKFEWE